MRKTESGGERGLDDRGADERKIYAYVKIEHLKLITTDINSLR